ncbi:hypothetical protein INS49_012127 [Diaporthe citri]|uniref:uncharacterized protein n=1 Tax=Diaporthe citri TaxID=83186 RepID=UPI001C7E4834|nr:uncharacterized protein INS49_012127 [Diaporthe citri]KAG6358609.1 hypothetical protein INS49_012127 [Diaporthe citri]
MGDENGNFAIPCSPAPDPFVLTSYGRCSLSFQCATKNNNGDSTTIWGFLVQLTITAATEELEDHNSNKTLTGAWVHMNCQHHDVHTIMGFNGSDSG